MNYVAGSATVHHHEAKTTLEKIRQRVASGGYHCRGELVPAHVCDPGDKGPKVLVRTEHVGHAGHVMIPARTQAKAVLICLLMADRAVEIVTDRGIDAKVEGLPVWPPPPPPPHQPAGSRR